MEENENRDERRGADKSGKLDKLPPMFGHFCCRLAVQPYCRLVCLFLFLVCKVYSGYLISFSVFWGSLILLWISGQGGAGSLR